MATGSTTLVDDKAIQLMDGRSKKERFFLLKNIDGMTDGQDNRKQAQRYSETPQRHQRQQRECREDKIVAKPRWREQFMRSGKGKGKKGKIEDGGLSSPLSFGRCEDRVHFCPFGQ
ncbi:unnamed protein product [Calypogeia fissa]